MYRFYLKKDDTTYYQYNGATVITTTVASPLNHLPKGWENISINWNRDSKYHGVFRSITTELQFVEDGAKILKHLYVTQGVEAVCICRIMRQNDFTLDWELFYEGNVDFSKINIEPFFVNANLIEGGLKSLIDANEDIDYEILIDPTDPNYKKVFLDGIILQDTLQYVPMKWSLGIDTAGSGYPNIHPSVIAIDAFIGRDGDYPIGTTKNSELRNVYTGGANIPEDEWNDHIFRATIAQTIRVRVVQFFKFQTLAALKSGLNIEVMVCREDKTIKSKTTVFSIPAGSITDSLIHQYTIDQTTGDISLDPDDRVYILYTLTFAAGQTQALGVITVDGNAPQDLTYHTDIISTFRMPSTHVGGYNYYFFMKRLIESMTANAYTGNSAFLSTAALNTLDCYPFSEIVTCGDALREFANSKIRTSLSDMFKDLSSAFGMGMSIQSNEVKFEPLSTFYNKDIIISDLGDVSNFTWEPALDLIANTLNIGYKSYDYDKLNGRYEYNTGFLWELPIKSNKAELEKISPYRADVLGIEGLRSNLSQKKTTDSNSDNDTFVIDCDPTVLATDGSLKAYRPSGTITGIPFPLSYYNFGRTPKRSFWRNGPYLHSILDLLDSKTIKFRTTDKNPDLITDFGNGYIDENRDELVSDLATKLFKPIVFRFKAIPPVNIAALMATNPNGCFRFHYNGNSYKGFPTTVGANLGDFSAFDFVLLCTSDTDLTPLI